MSRDKKLCKTVSIHSSWDVCKQEHFLAPQKPMQIMSILGDSSEVALPPLDAPMYVGVAGPAPPPTSPLSRPMSANSQGVAQPSSLPGDQAAQPGAEPEEEAARTCFCGFFIEVIPLV